MLKYLEDLTAEKLVASNGQVLTKSQADDLLGKNVGSGASAADWMTESPNFKNGVYEIREGFSVQESGSRYIIEIKDGKLTSIDPRTGFTSNLPRDFDFVLMKDGTVRFGQNHSYISRDQGVRYAGQISLIEGKKSIATINNGSGHYAPNILDSEGKELAENALKRYFKEVSVPQIVKHPDY